MEYSLVTPERLKTFIQATLGKPPKPLIIGMVEQTRPGRFVCILYPKPETIEAIQRRGPAWGLRLDHNYKRRNDAIWAIKTAFEVALAKNPSKETTE